MDDFHKNKKDIYLMAVQQSPGSQIRLIEASCAFNFDYKKYPEIKNCVSVTKYKEGELRFIKGESVFLPEGLIVGSTFFDFFDFNLKIGDKRTILNDPYSLILTEQLATKIFGSEDPIGKSVQIISRKENVYTVKGIIEKPASNSSIIFDFILPSGADGYDRTCCDFLLAGSNFDPVAFSEKIKDLGQINEQFKNSQTSIIPFSKIYFNEEGIDTFKLISRFGDKKSIYVFWAIMGIIFIISLLNFSNLQILNINSSVKNIGINKIAGAGLNHIFYQKIVEVLILVLFSAILITAAFFVVSPYFYAFTGVYLSLSILNIFILNLFILFLLIVGSFIYPSIVFYRIQITNSLKKQLFSDAKLVGRKMAIVAQFALSMALLMASITVVRQLDFMLNKDLGFQGENIISTKFFHRQKLTRTREERENEYSKVQNNFQYVNNELGAQGFIKNFARGRSPITPSVMPWKTDKSGQDYISVNNLSVTPEYLNLLGLTVTEGRFFERGRDESRGIQVVINETAKKIWGIEDISGTRVLNKYWSLPQMGAGKGFEIIGVVKDFNSEHLSVRTQPLVMFYFDDIDANYLIEIEPGARQAGILFLTNLFGKVNPGEPFHYSFLSDDVNALYQKEKRLSTIYIIFTVIAFFISGTGLFTIALYDTRKRVKEIGVRKVNGARVSEILTMLNKDFVKWVVIAFVIACPIAYYAMHQWLGNFAYKTTLSWWIFVLAGVLALGIALLTVSWQSWRAATRNPVEALRYE